MLTVFAAVAAVWLWRGPRDRRAAYAAGAWTLLAVALVSPLCALTSALFSARVVHHGVVMLLAAALAALAFRSSPSAATAPALILATLLQVVVLWLWHAPPLYGWALSNDAVYWLMQLTLLGSSVLFWRSIRSAPDLAAVLALGITMAQMGLLGALIALADAPLYAPHLLTTTAWGLTPLEDQQLAGLIMWAPMAAVYLAAAVVRAAPMLRDEPRPLRT